MATKKPGPRSKTQSQEAKQDLSSSSSSLYSGFLISPRRQEVPLQQHQNSLPSSTRPPRPRVLKNSNPNRSAEPDSGFINREDVTDEVTTEAEEGADCGYTDRAKADESSGGSSRFLDDDLEGEIDTFLGLLLLQPSCTLKRIMVRAAGNVSMIAWKKMTVETVVERQVRKMIMFSKFIRLTILPLNLEPGKQLEKAPQGG